MPIDSRTIRIPGGSPDLAAYLAEPSGEGKHPGLVVIHEIWGLNDGIRGVADRFASQGYPALAVDLFAGRNRYVCLLRFMGGMIANAFDHSGIKDLRAALTYLAAQPNVDPDRLGTIGFCLGGNFAICWACKDNRLKVIAPFYAANPLRVKAVEDSCPVVGSYPEKDWTAPCGRKLDRTLDNYGIKHDIKIYPGAKHSFFYGGRHVDEQASADAWKRTLTFFKEEIG